MLLHSRYKQLIFLFFIAVISSCAQADRVDNSGLIASFPSSAHKSYTYRLMARPCKQSPCYIEVQLLEQGKVHDSQKLPWHAGSQDISASEVTKWYGIGDPLDNDTQHMAWTIGNEYEYVSILALPVKLAKGIDGLLVAQTTGIEHVRRRHQLYSIQKGKLTRIWDAEEASGPAWSTVMTYPHAEGNDGLLYLSAVQYSALGSSEYFDTVDIKSLHWDSVTNSIIRAKQSGPKVHFVVIYPYQNMQNAAEDLARYRDCLGDAILLLDISQKFPGLKSKAALVSVTGNKKLAETANTKLKQCIPNKTVREMKH